jgi:hypothetical protein
MQDLATLTYFAMFFIGLVWNVVDWRKETSRKQQMTTDHTESEAKK